MSTRRAGISDENRIDSRIWMMYVRYAAMILTGMFVMYWVMFVSSWEWSHVRFSESRIFMALTMGGAMGLVMLAWSAEHVQEHESKYRGGGRKPFAPRAGYCPRPEPSVGG